MKNGKYLLIKFSGDEVGNERDLTSMNNRSVRAKDTNVLRPFFVSGIEDQDNNSQL